MPDRPRRHGGTERTLPHAWHPSALSAVGRCRRLAAQWTSNVRRHGSAEARKELSSCWAFVCFTAIGRRSALLRGQDHGRATEARRHGEGSFVVLGILLLRSSWAMSMFNCSVTVHARCHGSAEARKELS